MLLIKLWPGLSWAGHCPGGGSQLWLSRSVGLSQAAKGELGCNFCLLQLQAQIDHYLGLVNKNVKDAMAK